jgi:hypothetical protein
VECSCCTDARTISLCAAASWAYGVAVPPLVPLLSAATAASTSASESPVNSSSWAHAMWPAMTTMPTTTSTWIGATAVGLAGVEPTVEVVVLAGGVVVVVVVDGPIRGSVLFPPDRPAAMNTTMARTTAPTTTPAVTAARRRRPAGSTSGSSSGERSQGEGALIVYLLRGCRTLRRSSPLDIPLGALDSFLQLALQHWRSEPS